MNTIKSSFENKVSHFLRQPYPFCYSGRTLWTISGLLFTMTLLFNYFFEPFNVYVPEHKMDFLWISFIHAVIPPILLLIISVCIKLGKIEEKWIIKKEFKFILFLMIIIGFAQFLIRDIIYDNVNNWSFKYLYEEIRNTLLEGILFITILVPLNFNRLYSKNIKQASSLNDLHAIFQPLDKSKILITTKLKNEDLELDINTLLFAKAEGNYVEFYLKEAKVNKVILRITLKELESTLKPYGNIIKTHRSYLVNMYHIKNITGNAQGYRLHLNNCDEIVPVSRYMINDFNTKLKSN